MQRAPYLSAIFVFAGLAALGLPGTMGFIGEISILISSIDAYGVWLAVIVLGSMLSASYLIWTFRRVIYGESSEIVRSSDFTMVRMEFLSLILFAGLILLFGLYPQPLFDAINHAFSAYAATGGAL